MDTVEIESREGESPHPNPHLHLSALRFQEAAAEHKKEVRGQTDRNHTEAMQWRGWGQSGEGGR